MAHLAFLVMACGLALALTPLVRRLAQAMGVVDQPSARKIHTAPVPLLGGVSVIAAVGLTILAAIAFEQVTSQNLPFDISAVKPILLGGALVFCVGVWDDCRPLPVWLKFALQAVAAGVTVGYGIRVNHISLFGGSGFHLGVWGLPISFLWLIGITNAFNLLDGLDGLATGLAIIIAASNAAFFYLLGDTRDLLLLLILLGALLGFLRYNFNPATIFLGDSGSLVIGYVLAATALSGTQKSVTTLAVVVPLLVFGLPIADTLLSMTRRFLSSLHLLQSSKARLKDRLLCTKAMFEADKRHIHHRLLALGLSHRNAVLLLYGIALGLSSLALLSVLAQYRNAGMMLITFGAITYIGIRKLGYDEVVLLRSGTVLRWYEQAKVNRRLCHVLIDMALISLAYWGALLLKYDTLRPESLHAWHLQAFPIKLVMQLVFFYLMDVYRGVWRAFGIHDLIRLSGALLLASMLTYSVALLHTAPEGTLSFFCIDAVLLGMLIVTVRGGYQILDALRYPVSATGKETLIYGAGRRGQLMLKELQQHTGLQPVGFLDDDNTLHGRTVNRIPVLGSADDLKSILEHRPIDCLVLSSDHISELRLRRMATVCRECNIAVVQSSIHLQTLGLEPFEKAS
jgi:UDP-GlcNAc:undecaprenyl-phosphate GlcNAc-1-phosphate transferase